MKSPNCCVAIIVLVFLPLALTAGCGSKEEIITPNKPPLSKEESLKRAEAMQQDRIKALKDQANQKKRKK